jgi:hypothetical protein
MKRALIAASACLFLGSAALADELPTASPSEVGMSSYGEDCGRSGPPSGVNGAG